VFRNNSDNNNLPGISLIRFHCERVMLIVDNNDNIFNISEINNDNDFDEEVNCDGITDDSDNDNIIMVLMIITCIKLVYIK